MALQKKYPCPYHQVGFGFQDYIEHPHWCPTCRGTMFWEGDVYLRHYKGKFKSINWRNVGISDDDISLRVNCVCGDNVFFSEGGEPKVCSCGRIYRLDWSVKVDETHIGEIDWLIEESNKKE